MKFTPKNIIIILAISILTSCGMASKVNFIDGWLADEVYEYNYTAVDGDENGDLMIYFSNNQDYKYENVIFELEVITPDSLRMTKEFSISLGSVSDSVSKFIIKRKCRTNKIIISDMRLKQGKYQFKLKQIVSDTLHGVRNCKLRIAPRRVDE